MAMYGQQSMAEAPKEDFAPSAIEDSLFREIVDTTGGGLAQFIAEYEKLQQALRKSHESETRFVNKCRELTKQIQTSSEKTQVLNNMLEEEKRQIDTLNTQLAAQRSRRDTALNDVDAGRALIKTKRDEMAAIGKQLEQDIAESVAEQEAKIARMEGQIEAQTKIRDEERADLSKLRAENIELHTKYEHLLTDHGVEEKEIRELDEKIAETNNESATEARKKDDFEEALREAKIVFKDRGTALRARLQEADEAKQELATAEAALQGAEAQVEDSTNRLHTLTMTVEELETLHKQTFETNNANEDALKQFSVELEKLQAEVEAAKRDAGKRARLVEAMKKKVAEAEEKAAASSDDKDQWVAKNKDAQRSVELQQVKVRSVSKQTDTAVREREMVSQNTAQKRAAIKSKEAALSMARSTVSSLEIELQGFHSTIEGLKSNIAEVQADTEKYEEELAATELLKAKALEEAAQRELEVANLQHDIAELEGKMRTQQNLLEAVRADRNAYSKQLIQQKDDMSEQKHKFSHLNLRILQVKQEISDKDADLVTEHFKLQRLNNDIQDLTKSVATLQARISEKEETIRTQSSQLNKLGSIVGEAEEESKAQQKQYAAIINEQRVLNTQLVARNQELATLYEKLKLQHSLLVKGERSYRDVIAQIKQREAQRDNLISQYSNTVGDQGEFELLQESTRALEAQLLEERRLVAALEAELQRPVNVHKWRQLSDTSAETFGLVKKVHELQREIIARADEVVSKDSAIQEKEKLYVDLRKVLARQPGPEATEQLRVFALTLKEKKSKFEAMKAELKMYQAKVYEYKYDIEKLTKDIELIKLSYFQQRRQQIRQAQKQQQQAFDTFGYQPDQSASAAAAYDAFSAQNALLTAAALQAQSQGLADAQLSQYMAPPVMPMDSSALAAAAAAAIAAANAATDAAASRNMQYGQ